MYGAITEKTCYSCPRRCAVNRTHTAGFCGATTEIVVAAQCLHRGEEPVISGTGGSGAIFFSHCNLRCVYCQNYDISWHGLGSPYSQESLVSCMMNLQKQGAHNINFVSPSQYAYALPAVICRAREQGLTIPILYNSNGYDDCTMLRALSGLVDIYMPDCKYSDNEQAKKYSACDDYVEISQKAVREMFRQVGPLVCTKDGIAEKGMLVRHLVLPDDYAGSRATLDFLAHLSLEIPLSIMSQYHPCHQAYTNQALSRPITSAEYNAVISYAEACGFQQVFAQELVSHDHYLPDFFNEDHPFE